MKTLRVGIAGIISLLLLSSYGFGGNEPNSVSYTCIKERNKDLQVTTQAQLPIPWLGFGTDNVKSKDTFISAFEAGYRLFDLAEAYENIDLFKEALDSVSEKFDRKDLFLVYKVSILNIHTDKELDQFFNRLDQTLEKFHGRLDSLMLHDPIGNLQQVTLEALLLRLNTYVPAQIGYIGLSNVSTRRQLGSSFISIDEIQMIEKACEKYQEKIPSIALIENRFNPLVLDSEVRKFASESNIKYIGYSIFGGKALHREQLALWQAKRQRINLA